MSENQTEPARPKRRWLRRRRRSLLLLLIVAAPGTISLMVFKEAIEQKWAVEEIHKAGGTVEFGKGGRLSRLLGSDFDPVVRVEFLGTRVTDSDLRHLKGLTRLERLSTYGAHITDSGLQYLEGLTQLQSLRLVFDHGTVSDAGLQRLEHMTRLETLWLSYTTVTDDGLCRLKGMPRLEFLFFESSDVTAKGAEDLERSLPGLKVADVGDAETTEELMSWLAERSEEAREQAGTVEKIKKAGGSVAYGDGDWLSDFLGKEFSSVIGVEFPALVGDAELSHLKGLTRLKGIRVCASDVSDVGLQYLEGLPQLETVELSDSTVTNEGLRRLKGLTRLKCLHLSSSHAAKEGLEDLRRSLPGAEISVGLRDDSDEGRKPRPGDGRRDP